MALAKIVAGAPVELQPGRQVALANNQFVSWVTALSWTEEERNALGIYMVQKVDNALGANQKLGPAVLAFNGTIVTATRQAVAIPTEDDMALTCTPLQFRRALRATAKYAAVLAYVNTTGADTLDWWQTAKTIRRDDPMIATIAEAVGVGNGALNTLFRNAALIGAV